LVAAERDGRSIADEKGAARGARHRLDDPWLRAPRQSALAGLEIWLIDHFWET